MSLDDVRHILQANTEKEKDLKGEMIFGIVALQFELLEFFYFVCEIQVR